MSSGLTCDPKFAQIGSLKRKVSKIICNYRKFCRFFNTTHAKIKNPKSINALTTQISHFGLNISNPSYRTDISLRGCYLLTKVIALQKPAQESATREPLLS